MIAREGHRTIVRALLREFPVVAILGARQVGKTTLARDLARRRRGMYTYFDLENPNDLARLREPMLALERLQGLVVLDEVQRTPEIFRVLRVLADRRPLRARFLVLGSASPELLQQSSESLAGRIAFHRLPGLRLREIPKSSVDRLWLRGGFPPSFTARTEAASLEWRRQFVATFLERDLSQLGIRLPAETLRRFWQMLAHYHAQLWNGAELARAFGVSQPTVRSYLDILTSTFVIRQLQPWHQNISKRQVRAPKIYLADSGLLHTLLGITSMDTLLGHPKIGASWEGFALEQLMASVGVRDEDCHFWATHGGAELDLLVRVGGRRLGFEIKRTAAPELTPSMRIAIDDLELDHLYVVHAGKHTFPMSSSITAIPLDEVHL